MANTNYYDEHRTYFEDFAAKVVNGSKLKRARGSSIHTEELKPRLREVVASRVVTLARNKKQSNKLRRYLEKNGWALNRNINGGWQAIGVFAEAEPYRWVIITYRKEKGSKRRKLTFYQELHETTDGGSFPGPDEVLSPVTEAKVPQE